MRKIIFILLTIIICTMSTSCFDAREVDDLAYVMGIGLDAGKTNNLRITLQFAVPLAIGGGGEGGGGGGGESVNNIVVEAPSIYSGLNMANNFVSKQINMSHAKVLVISEELARKGVASYLHAMARGREFRPNMHVVVSRGTARDYLENVEPVLEANPAKFYEMSFQAFAYTGFSANTEMHNFYQQMKSRKMQPVATIVAVNNIEDIDEASLEDSTFKEKGRPFPFEGDYIAGNIPKVSKLKTEIMGLAVFDGDKMVGELDGEEATDYLMVTGQFKYAYFTLPDPQSPGRVIVVSVRQARKPDSKVEIINNKPSIKVEIELEGDIISIQSGLNYEDLERMPVLEKAFKEQVKSDMLRFLERTSREFKSDICGFGQQVILKTFTMDQWDKLNWLGIYKDATFNVDIKFNIRRTGLMIRSASVPSSEGEDTFR